MSPHRAMAATASKFVTISWLHWIVATAIAALSLCAFVFTNFETKEDSKTARDTLEKRLDRIENKLDKVLEK